MSAHPPEQQGDVSAVEKILHELAHGVVDYESVLREIQEHWAALKVLRTRLLGMRRAAKEWDDRLWDMALRDEVLRSTRANVQEQVRIYARELDNLIWQLFEFRERRGRQP